MISQVQYGENHWLVHTNTVSDTVTHYLHGAPSELPYSHHTSIKRSLECAEGHKTRRRQGTWLAGGSPTLVHGGRMQPPLSFLTTFQPSMTTTHIISHKEQYIRSHNSLTCLLANTKMVASLSSSSPNMRISSSLASPIRSRSLLSTTKINPTRQRVFTILVEQKNWSDYTPSVLWRTP